MPTEELKKLLASVYNQFQRLDDTKANAIARQDFVFHMSDWLDDLERLVAIYKQPERVSREQASEVAGFLYHVIPHLNAAGRLLLGDIPDAFDPKDRKV